MVHWFLAQNTDRSALSPTFDTEIGLCGSHGTEKKQWMGKLGYCLEAFCWQDYSCPTLAGVSGRLLKEMLRSIACRCMEKDWMEDLGSKPKLCVLNECERS